MIFNVDVKSLEIVVAALLANDEVLREEIIQGVDIHARNQEDFGLTDRLIAKVLVFRILYGGTEYGFVKDSDFTRVSKSLKYWRNAIDRFYDKYQGIARWHADIIQHVGNTGVLTTPFGRTFEFGRKPNGDLPQAAIKNYPVQGTGADIVAIARVSFYKRWMKSGCEGKFINTVHDSIELDIPDSEFPTAMEISNNVFKDLPSNIQRVFGVAFDLPIIGEVSIGPNRGDLVEVQ